MATDKKPSLRAVGPDGAPEVQPIGSIVEAAEHGSLLDEFIQMRRVMARVMDDSETNPTALAALTRQYRDLSKEIAAMKRQQSEEDAEDDVTADEEWSEEAI